MSSLFKDSEEYVFEYHENQYYWFNTGYGSPIKDYFKSETKTGDLQDLASTFHAHIMYWESSYKTEESFKANGISKFISTQNNFPDFLNRDFVYVLGLGLGGEIKSITSDEIIICIEDAAGELHVDLKETSFLKDTINDYFDNIDEKMKVGMNVKFDEDDIFFFIKTEGRNKLLKEYTTLIFKLNEVYEKSGYTKKIKLI